MTSATDVRAVDPKRSDVRGIEIAVTTMTCREFADFLSDYFAGELPEPAQATFDRHMAECPQCVAYLRSVRETIRLGKAAFDDPDEPVPDEVPEALVQAILAAQRARSR